MKPRWPQFLCLVVGDSGDPGSEHRLNCLFSLSLKHFSEPCEPIDSPEQGQLQDGRPAEAAEENPRGVLCRRASQEDMGLDDTASQQSTSDEQ